MAQLDLRGRGRVLIALRRAEEKARWGGAQASRGFPSRLDLAILCPRSCIFLEVGRLWVLGTSVFAGAGLRILNLSEHWVGGVGSAQPNLERGAGISAVASWQAYGPAGSCNLQPDPPPFGRILRVTGSSMLSFLCQLSERWAGLGRHL